MSSIPVDPGPTELECVTLGMFSAGANEVRAFQAFKLSRWALWLEDMASQVPKLS